MATKFFFWVALLMILACNAAPMSNLAAKVTFQKFKREHNRQYKTPAEEEQRFSCFMRTLERIEDWKKRDPKAQYGINKFSDMCPEEFKSTFHNLKLGSAKNVKFAQSYSPEELREYEQAPVPKSWDWRKKGAVNAVKDQQMCGSCWAFSAVAAMEGAWFVKNKKLLSLSEEEIVQCATSAGQGCEGGEMGRAINWVIQNHGLASEAEYPYVSGSGITGQCTNDTHKLKPVVKFRREVQAPANETLLPAFLVKNGPLFIAVDASDGWQSYTGGIKTICGGQDLDHGVAVVGFGPDHWIVRNSWGVGWGEQGYIRLQRDVNCDSMMTDVGTALV